MNITKKNKNTPLGQWADIMEGYWVYPRLEGNISNKVLFEGRDVISWSYNDYLGLANEKEITDYDIENVKKYGLTYPMGSRLLTGDSVHHLRLEQKLRAFSEKEDSMILNMGYQGVFSIIDALITRKDVVVYDDESHACTIDGVRLHRGLRLSFKHNDIDELEKSLCQAKKHCEKTGGSILVISEGVFSMRGDQGKIKEIVGLKKNYSFTFLLDDAHGFGVLGEHGKGTSFEQNVSEGVDLYFSTFTKSMASTGAFIAGKKDIIDYLKYNVRSQIYSRSLPLVFVLGLEKRLEIIERADAKRQSLFNNTNLLQKHLKSYKFNLGITNTCITPVNLSGTPFEAMAMVEELREEFNVFCSMVLYPVIPKGEIMMRLIPTANHTTKDIMDTVKSFQIISERLENNAYKDAEEKYKGFTLKSL